MSEIKLTRDEKRVWDGYYRTAVSSLVQASWEEYGGRQFKTHSIAMDAAKMADEMMHERRKR